MTINFKINRLSAAPPKELTYSEEGSVEDEKVLSHRKSNGSKQPDVSCGRHRKQILILTQAEGRGRGKEGYFT